MTPVEKFKSSGVSRARMANPWHQSVISVNDLETSSRNNDLARNIKALGP